jgi:cell shape-determining protein MreC
MNYHLKSKPKRKFSLKAVTVGVTFLILLALSFFFPTFSRNTAYTIARPFWFLADLITRPFPSIKNLFASKNTLMAENLALQNEITILKLKEVDYDILFKENQDLKNELGRTDYTSRILGNILSKPPTSPYDTLVIDVGENEGVVLGSKVYLGGNVIIGSITSVTSHTSLVELFSTGGRTQEAVLVRTGASYELTGKGGANLVLQIPKDTDVIWGDVFVYPSLSSSVIGSVYYIDSNSQSSFKTVHIRLFGNIFSSPRVFVEKVQ